MNFKLSWLKGVTSLIFGLAYHYYLIGSLSCFGGSWCAVGFDDFFVGFFNPFAVTYFLLIIIIVYVVWSLFQKKDIVQQH